MKRWFLGFWMVLLAVLMVPVSAADSLRWSGFNERGNFEMNNRDAAVPASELGVEQEIIAKGLTAPRVTPDRIDEVIVDEDYHVFEGSQLTVCMLTLENGFTVTGESACASPENFNAELGRSIARGNARDKIWALEGYVLKQALFDGGPKINTLVGTNKPRAANMSFGDALRELKAGGRVARKGWKGKGSFLELQEPDENSKMTAPYIYINTTGLQTDNDAAPKSLVPWLASQTDMLAEDWEDWVDVRRC